MSDVYRGTHPAHGSVVLKILARRLEHLRIFATRWNREMLAASKLSHVAAVPYVLDSGRHPRPWFLQRDVGAQNLRSFIRNIAHPLPSSSRCRVLSILGQILEVIVVANSIGITHRDVNPTNIVLGRDNTAYLVDWGICHFNSDALSSNCPPLAQSIHLTASLNKRLTEPFRRHGTVGFFAPEQAKARMDQPGIKNDLYSLVVIAVILLAGHSPFRGRGAPQVLRSQLAFNPDALENGPIWRATDYRLAPFLIPSPDERCQDPHLFATILRELNR